MSPVRPSSPSPRLSSMPGSGSEDPTPLLLSCVRGPPVPGLEKRAAAPPRIAGPPDRPSPRRRRDPRIDELLPEQRPRLAAALASAATVGHAAPTPATQMRFERFLDRDARKISSKLGFWITVVRLLRSLEPPPPNSALEEPDVALAGAITIVDACQNDHALHARLVPDIMSVEPRPLNKAVREILASRHYDLFFLESQTGLAAFQAAILDGRRLPVDPRGRPFGAQGVPPEPADFEDEGQASAQQLPPQIVWSLLDGVTQWMYELLADSMRRPDAEHLAGANRLWV